jgi:DNA-binding CsgD family transcriptional regulator
VSPADHIRVASAVDARLSGSESDWPSCAKHPGAPIHRTRTHGSQGLGVYFRCHPRNGDAPHLVSTPANARGLSHVPVHAAVTDVEREILADAAAGLTMLESAAKRDKGIETVKSQRRHILTKLDARNMTHAVSIAVRDGLIDRLPRGE